MSANGSLVAHHVLEFPGGYQRSVGPAVGRFLAGLREGRLIGVRTASLRVVVPPTEYDPETSVAVDDFCEVGPEGTVMTWAWVANPRRNHPLDTPFAWALIRPDGADTAMLHVVAAPAESVLRTGLRVQPRWREERVGHVLDICCFEPVQPGAGEGS
jgi:uncharacterized OB-fold protein